ncbi:cation diffusion facilitator family transporter [Veillonella sp. R32]|uniref:cation diffusion facilitator family transporter n=1 Tax=Veillonella sp. R32 TaxID=2021312 RepID=UPI00138A36C5|nr:cation diffusion facilitator family transporter [Veillonella sp. R32]KAF1682701.1 cation diffusion facilitator family transporter [Veillonella sp. R32]
MQEQLIRWFVKDYDCIKAPAVRTRYGHLTSIVGIVTNLIISLGELIVGLLIGSIAMVSDAIHDLADAGGSTISLLSFSFSAKKADQEHPYGHGRIEYLLSIGFSILLFVVAIQLLIESVGRILKPEIIEFSIWALVVMLCAMGLKVWLYTFFKSIGERINSPILQANGLEYLSDVWATLGITLGLVAGGLFQIPVDGYLGAIVSLMIGRAGYHVLADAISRLLGNEPSPEMVKDIANFVKSYPGVLGVHDLMIHDYGPGHVFASIHVEVDAKEDVIKSHSLIDRIERDAQKELYLQLTIHMDPLLIMKESMALYDKIHTVVKAYDEKLSLHDLRAVKSDDKTHIIFDLVVPYSDRHRMDEIAKAIKKILEAMDPSFEITITAEHSYTGDENIHDYQ